MTLSETQDASITDADVMDGMKTHTISLNKDQTWRRFLPDTTVTERLHEPSACARKKLTRASHLYFFLRTVTDGAVVLSSTKNPNNPL